MSRTEKLLERCFKCAEYPDGCGVYFMMALWKKECKFFVKRENDETH